MVGAEARPSNHMCELLTVGNLIPLPSLRTRTMRLFSLGKGCLNSGAPRRDTACRVRSEGGRSKQRPYTVGVGLGSFQVVRPFKENEMDIDFSGLWNNGLVVVAVGAIVVSAVLLTLCGMCGLWQDRGAV